MRSIPKNAFSRELGCSEPTLRRVISLLHLTGKPLDEIGALKILLCAELQALDVQPRRSVEIVAGLHDEIRHVASHRGNRCWLLITDQHSFAPITSRHLDALLNNYPVATIVSVHELVQRSAERLDAMLARLASTKEAA